MQRDQPEINSADLLRIWWKRRRQIFVCSLIGLAAGLVLAFVLPGAYTCTVKLIAQTESSGIASELSGLTSLVGINLNRLRPETSFDPAIYPEIVASTPFLTEIAHINVNGQETSTYVPGIGKNPHPSDKDASKIHQYKLLELLRKHIGVFTDKKSGLTAVSVTLNDPLAAAMVADSVSARLERYLIASRTRKAQADYVFASERFEESRTKYYTAQEAYARFQDSNRHMARELAAVERNRLYQEQQLAYTVYSQLAAQLEVARLKVQEQTPVLTVIEPAIEPFRRSSPRRSLIVLGGLLLGAVIPMGVVLAREYIS